MGETNTLYAALILLIAMVVSSVKGARFGPNPLAEERGLVQERVLADRSLAGVHSKSGIRGFGRTLERRFQDTSLSATPAPSPYGYEYEVDVTVITLPTDLGN